MPPDYALVFGDGGFITESLRIASAKVRCCAKDLNFLVSKTSPCKVQPVKYQTRKQIPAHWTTVEYSTILEAIEDHGVFYIEQKTPSRWVFRDGCDDVNLIELSAMHLRGLAEELIALADKDDALRRARGMTEDDERIFPVMDAPPNEE